MKHLFSKILFRAGRAPANPFRLQSLYFGYLLSGSAERELLDLAQVVGEKRRGTAIDIGANEGFWAYKMSKLFAHVHAFEINPAVSAPIAASGIANLHLHEIGLSDETGEKEFYTPIHRSQKLRGWGSLEKRELDFATEFEVLRFRVEPLDGFGLENVDFIKIDVEGHEMQVLLGAKATILKNRPIMVIESEGAVAVEVARFLAPMGYRAVALKDISGAEGSPQNLIFFPKE